jgi:carboxyl-terminal processing protease
MLQTMLNRALALLRTRLIPCTLSLAAASAGAQPSRMSPEMLAEIQKLAAIQAMIGTDYVHAVNPVSVMNSCMKGMLAGLDAQSVYFDAEAFEEFRNGGTTGEVGIGVELTLRAGLPSITTAIDGSAAQRAGLNPKDYILEVDGHSMEESTLEEAVKRLRGAPGSSVDLLIRRPGEAVNRSLRITRELTRMKPVSASKAFGNVGYIKLSGFTDQSAPALRAAFNAMPSPKTMKGLVLDLRNSPGGLLTATIEIAAMFLPAGAPVVSLEGRLPESNQSIRADRQEILRNRNAINEPWPEAMRSIPMVVLVNAGTASGAEIVAGALQDNGRAKLVGCKTFGRGSIQTVRQLTANTGIKLTTAIYKTPKGHVLQNKGLVPDVQAVDPDRYDDRATAQDAGLKQALAMLGAQP